MIGKKEISQEKIKFCQGEVPASYSGLRLDLALKWLLPDWSLRQRRALCKTNEILVDGQPRSKGYKVKSGQWVVLPLTEKEPEQVCFPFSAWPELRIVEVVNGFAAVYKPTGLHCQALALQDVEALENALPDMFAHQETILLNRLDRKTSGLVLVALDSKSCEQYNCFQENGRIIKSYWALVQGKIKYKFSCRWMIDSAKKRKVRVVNKENQSFLRWTRVRPVQYLAGDKTLIQVQILKGQRHQIRAHLAFAGFPIVGDSLYGRVTKKESLMFLHHYQIAMPDFFAQAQPSWPGFQLNGQGEI